MRQSRNIRNAAKYEHSAGLSPNKTLIHANWAPNVGPVHGRVLQDRPLSLETDRKIIICTVI